MAFEERKHDARRHSAQGRGSNRSGVFFGGAVVIFAIVGAVAYIGLRDAPLRGSPADPPVEDVRPAGAGTNPDGAADEFTEGLGNETTREDFIEPGTATEAFPNPLLEGPGDAPDVPSIDQLDPGPGVDDEVLERMAPNDEAPVTTDEAGEAPVEPEDL